jgi:hypothetical protein
MRRQNPDKGLKLIGDAASKDSGAKYFLAMLKYRCNPADPEAMALLHEISDGPSPPTVAALPRQTGSREHCMMVLAW